LKNGRIVSRCSGFREFQSWVLSKSSIDSQGIWMFGSCSITTWIGKLVEGDSAYHPIFSLRKIAGT